MQKFYYKLSLLLLVLTAPFSSCRKFVDVEVPSTSTSAEVVYSADGTAIAVMTGIYAQMNSGLFTSLNAGSTLSLYPELSADNLVLFATNTDQYASYYHNTLSANTSLQTFWDLLYPLIYTSNSVIEGVGKSTTLTPAVKSQLLGEAYFIRAFFYFYLVNLYGDVPLVLTTAYNQTATFGRTPSSKVYEQIVLDLTTAQGLLNDNYLDGTLLTTSPERLRPNKSTATALLARVYLFTRDFAKAETEATSLINKTTIYQTSGIAANQVFLKNSKETIWALQPVRVGENTPEARFFIIPAAGPNTNSNPVYLSSQILQAFELNDQRRKFWVDSVIVSGITYRYIAKYKTITTNGPINEYGIVFRLAEQYLIRAEARTKLGKLIEAAADLNIVRNRANLINTAAATEAELLNAILQERRVELFAEWGHRWLDLKRTGQVDAVMTSVASVKGSTWNTNWQYYPIPSLQLVRNSNLIQNSGY